jgi:hypothetical protein
MRAVAGVLKPMPAAISVEGHTDDVPMRSERFPSNWELSTARASSMVRILLEAGIPADRAQALQAAFMASARDPDFGREASKINLELTPLDAKQTLAVVQRLADIPQAQRDKLRDIMYGAPKN